MNDDGQQSTEEGLKAIKVLETAPAVSVIVVAVEGDTGYAIFGATFATLAKSRRLQGFVADGSMRGIADFQRLGLPGTITSRPDLHGHRGAGARRRAVRRGAESAHGAIADDPSERALLPIHPDALRRSLRVQRHGLLAIAGGRLQGLITASFDDVVRDALRLNVVLVRKDQRRHGVASAMLASLRARHDGAPLRLVTPAAADLTAWLTSRGFVQVAECLVLERLLRKTVPLGPELLDEYVGRYVGDARPGEPIVIERHGDTLISKTRDMRDVLLASSESEFFTRYHDGRGRFERDETGRVARLVIREGPREFIAIRR